MSHGGLNAFLYVGDGKILSVGNIIPFNQEKNKRYLNFFSFYFKIRYKRIENSNYICYNIM